MRGKRNILQAQYRLYSGLETLGQLQHFIGTGPALHSLSRGQQMTENDASQAPVNEASSRLPGAVRGSEPCPVPSLAKVLL